jgi:Carboxypeptidase regulatory-like domain
VGNGIVIYSTVAVSGTTSFTPLASGSIGALPDGYLLLGENTAYEISTTAVVTPPIVVCFVASAAADPVTFAKVRILHGENGQFVDRTILAPDSPAPDFATRTVCARVNSLSPFVAALAPASTVATVSGRVLTPSGLGLRNALVSMIDSQGIRRTATTSSFGLYTFENVRITESYTLSVSSKRYRFTPRILPVNGNLANIDFVGLE